MWRRTRLPGRDISQVALDEKCLRGTGEKETAGQPDGYLFARDECPGTPVLAHRWISDKDQEISAAGALVHPGLVKSQRCFPNPHTRRAKGKRFARITKRTMGRTPDGIREASLRSTRKGLDQAYMRQWASEIGIRGLRRRATREEDA